MSDLRSRATTRERARLSFTAIAYLLFSRRRTTFEQSIRDIAPYTSDRFRPRRRWKRSNLLSGPPKKIPPTIRLSGLRRPPVTQRAPASRSLMDAVMRVRFCSLGPRDLMDIGALDHSLALEYRL